ncbi:ATP-binding protein [Burkholderia sp. Bp9143]|uniref:ATP-binding protein n=1 Tax=Burkholderia sp. Bp9143 TaxID=2184574 RepID=UPI0016287E1A|nr:ATP-binding protein [Burkholderia sp. Bp9143]
MDTNSSTTTGISKDMLANASPEFRRSYFHDLRIRHPKLTETINELMRRITNGSDRGMIILTGPAGVGKSVACEYIVQNLIKTYFQNFPDDTQTIPAIMVEAEGTRSDRFDWYELDKEILEALQVPLIDATLPMVTRTLDGRLIDVPMVESLSHPTSRALRARFRKALDQRNPSVVAIDEASNILAGPKTSDSKREANVLKTIINKNKTRLILIGAYDLYQLATKTGQLTRRSQIVHFEPYRDHSLKGFAEALSTFQDHLPFSEPFPLTAYSAELFEQSLGCIGLLKDILEATVNVAISEGKKTIAIEMLRRNYFRRLQFDTLIKEILEGYRLIEGREYANLPAFLARNASTKNRGRKNRPGVRSPGRDNA